MSSGTLIDERQADLARADELRWARYREFLGTVDAQGNIPAASRPKFWKLAEEMNLSPGDVANHLELVNRHAKSKDADARSEQASKDRAALEPQIAEWAARRAKVLDELDSEGMPLVLRAQELERTVRELEWTRTTWRELEGEFPKLFGVVVAREPVKPLDADYDPAEISLAQSFLAGYRELPDGPVDVRELIGTHTLERIQKAVRRGWVEVPPIRKASILGALPKPVKDSAAERREQQRREERDRADDAELSRLTTMAERESAKQFAARLSATPDDAGAVADLTPRAREILAKAVAAGWVELSPTHADALKTAIAPTEASEPAEMAA